MAGDPNDFFELAFQRVNQIPSPSPSLSPNTSRPFLLEPPRALRRTRSASPAPPSKSVPRPPILTPERQTLIRKCWQRVPRAQYGDALMNDLVARIGRRVFGEDQMSVERHTRHFVDLIQCCVDNLGDLESALQPWLDTLGCGHAGFHIKARHWEQFGEAFLASIAEWVGPGRQHKETVKAWMLLSSFLSDRLSAASRSSASPMLTPRVQLLTFALP